MIDNRMGAIFDLDGTLLDSMGVWRKIDEDFLGKRGFVVPDDYLVDVIDCYRSKYGQYVAAEYTKERFNLPESEEEIIKEWFDMAIEAYTNEVKLKAGVIDYLKQLKAEGIKIAAATSSDERLFRPCLTHCGIMKYFDAFTVTQEVKRGKGFPDVYQLAAEKLSLKPEQCVVYEDILKGVEGAKMDDFYVVGVEDIHSSYEKNEIMQLSDRYILSFEELLD